MFRPAALIPALLCAGALVLSFLCLFAGEKKDFLENYHLLTLNTSRIGENLLNSSLSSDNPFSSLLHNITDSIGNEINEATEDIAKELGIKDFYSVHILDYCYGEYVPGPVANSTVSQKSIHKNVTGCSNRTAMYTFNPTQILEQALNQSGVDITLDDLDWPSDIQKGIDALRVISKATFVLYCIAIALIAVSLIAALPALFASGRLAACCNVMIAILAWLAIGLASALVTAVIVKGGNVINKYGKEVGVQAHKGGKFLAITWAATAMMFLVIIVWVLETCIGHRRRRDTTYVAKHG